MVKLSLRMVPYLTGYVHTQTNPFYSYSTSQTIAAAKRIISIYKALDSKFDTSRVCIKIPSTWEGLQACRKLESESIATLATTLFCMEQVALAADAGCTYIAPYVNELKVHFDADFIDKNKAFPLCHKAQKYFQIHPSNPKTQVLPASLISIDDVMRLAGVHHITVSPALLMELSLTKSMKKKYIPIFPDEDLRDVIGNFDFRYILKDESRWRLAFTMAEEGESERKLGQALRIFCGMQRGLEGFVRGGADSG